MSVCGFHPKCVIFKWIHREIGIHQFAIFGVNQLITDFNLFLITICSSIMMFCVGSYLSFLTVALIVNKSKFGLFLMFQICLRTACVSFQRSSVSSSLWRLWACTTMGCVHCPPAWATSRPSPTSTSGNSTPCANYITSHTVCTTGG